MRVLVLGGTGEARTLAAQLHRRGVPFVSSLAGRVTNPALPVGDVRIGGFGGADGLARYLAAERITHVVDATHPFAATITGNAAAACAATGTPLVVLRRPGWRNAWDNPWWHVPTVGAAAKVLRDWGTDGTVFLTTGRRDLAEFAGDAAHRFLVRTVDPPAGPVPPRMTLVLDRGPYTFDGERTLMLEHEVSVLVTKNSGGRLTRAKLEAAGDLRLPVIMVSRPPLPAGVTVTRGVPSTLTQLGLG